MSTADFLVELGTEELPPKALLTLGEAFRDGIVSRLTTAGVAHGKVDLFATPRRLAVRIKRLAAEQPEQLVQRRGPPVRAAFDAAGAPTRAATAFAQSCGVELTALARETDPKGNEYLSYSGVKAGAVTPSLLPGIIGESLDALPIPKRMRWGAGEAQFVRPVQWLVLLWGSEVLPARLLDVDAGRESRGHRYLSKGNVRIASPASYERALETKGRVIASFEARRERIRAGIDAIASETGGRVIVDATLLDEVTSLVEWPVPLVGRFEERFLALPRELLIATLQEHQRLFPVEDAAGKLLPAFVAVSNIDSLDPSVVRAGNERVVRPRLSDAAFFWEQDRRQPLAARVGALDAVTFQAQLGSIGAKVGRVQKLAARIAADVGADVAQAERAALLAKCDLVSNLVGEFPELQGVMGGYYAAADGEPAEVSRAIAQHYQPRGAGDDLPSTPTALAVALADRLDTLAGIFAIGQKPSGTRDPFALRRAAIGVLRMIVEKKLPLDLAALIDAAVQAQPVGEDRAAISTQVYDYVMERLRASYLEADASTALPGVTTELFDAVLATRPRSPLDFDARLRAMLDFLALPDAASLTAANKRIANLLKKSASGASSASTVDAALLRVDAERALNEALTEVGGPVRASVARGDYDAALRALSTLRPRVDAFFDGVMVMDEDLALRANRIALLTALRDLFSGIADLSRLPG
ncbi:MAG: glycine--tRNA ligase subunit beta [Steroidobacteraceae bacterium]